MFGWLTERRRNKLRQQPFPEAWETILDSTLVLWRKLDESSRARLRQLIAVFIAEKRWEGCAGLELTDEHRVTIAALACMLLLGPARLERSADPAAPRGARALRAAGVVLSVRAAGLSDERARIRIAPGTGPRGRPRRV
jgi:hypothetical protein